MTGGPDALVAAYEASLGAHERAAGAVYTPRPLADALVELALAAPGGTHRVPTVCDPAVGGGTFLLAAADALVRRGVPPVEVVASGLWGADVDPGAVDVARAAVGTWLAAQEQASPAQGSTESAGVAEVARGAVAAGGRRRRAVGVAQALASLRAHVVVADSLAEGADDVWPDRPAAGFDAVVGNPPFQDQLTAGTARAPAAAAALRRRLGAAVTAYADTATLFLVAAHDLVRPGGRVVLIVPLSVLAARDAAPARAEVLARARLDGLWWSNGPVFAAAAVEVCAPVLTVAGEAVAPGLAPLVARWQGAGVEPVAPLATPGEGTAPGSWSFLASDLVGVPPSGLAAAVPARRSRPSGGGRSGPTAATLGALVRATAGFRHQYYGIVPHVRESGPPGPDADRPDVDPPGADPTTVSSPRGARPGDRGAVDGAAPQLGAPLVTSGLIEPGRCEWGRRPCRFAGRSWERPVVDLETLRADDDALARWADGVLVPKVVLATQTAVLEAAVDRAGRWWPSVPVVAVVPDDPELVDRVAAVLLAPAVSAWAFERAAGSALSPAAVKLAARDVLEVPLPADGGAWAAAAERVPELAADDPERARRALDELGALMARAYASDVPVVAWWRDRLEPRRPRGRRGAAGRRAAGSARPVPGRRQVVD